MRGNHKDQLIIADQQRTPTGSIGVACRIKPRRYILSLCLLVVLLSIMIGSNLYAKELTLAWDPNTEPDLDGYTVYYSKGSPGPPYDYAGDLPLSDLPDPDNPQVTLTDLEEQVNYYIALTAYDINGNESSFSSSICIYIDGVIQECAPSSVVSTPVVGSSSGGGSSNSGACFIGTASREATAVPGKMRKHMVGWYSLLILAGLLLILASRSGKVDSASDFVVRQIQIGLNP